MSAPMEMRSAPAAAMARTFFSVMPPDTSTRACFLINATARRMQIRRHVVQQNNIRLSGERLPNLSEGFRLDNDRDRA